MKEITYSRWDYILFEDNDGFILTVFFSDQIDYPRSFRMKLDSVKEEDLKLISRKVRENYDSYSHLEIIPPIVEIP